MAATINSPGSSNAFDLICKVDVSEFVTCAVLLHHEEGAIVCSGKNIRIWLKRDSGQYWPSVCKTMTAMCSCMDYNHETQRLFVGLETGTVCEFQVADDFNKLIPQRDYFAHNAGVVSVIFALSCEWLVSIGRSKQFIWQCSETAHRLGCFEVAEFCYSLQFDAPSKYAFIGDYSGNITILRLSEDSYELITRLNAHTGCVKALVWDAERQLLFSGSFDKLIIVWDIGSRKGVALELLGHDCKIIDLKLAYGSKKLFSCDESGVLLCWDTTVARNETPKWQSSDNCQLCQSPFLWNVKEMWNRKIVGARQHHCRTCGKAVCEKCSENRMKYPPIGYELNVRVCKECFVQLGNKTFESSLLVHQTRHNLICISIDEMTGHVLTAGADKILKIWDAKKALLV